MTDVVLVGEPMGLFSATEYGSLKDAVQFNKSIAGAEFNVGIGLARLNHSVEYVTKLGKEPIGAFIVEEIEKEKIGSQFISYSDTYPTGLMMKNKVEDGDPATAYFRKSSAFTTLSKADVDAIDFSEVKLLHVTGIPPAVSETVREAVLYLMKEAKEAGTLITFDPNLRPSLWSSPEEMITVLNELATYADVVLPGISEGEILTGSTDIKEMADFYLNKGAKAVIAKSGEEGAYITEKGQETFNVPGFKVETVVDTVGAGDGFAVGIIHALLKDVSLKEAGVYANAIGSLQVQHVGDNEGLPTLDELEQYIAEKTK